MSENLKGPYPHLIESIRDWPIYNTNRDRKKFKKQLKQEAFRVLQEKNIGHLKDLLAQCAYSEKKRVQGKPWKVDPASEKGFWLNVSNQITSGKECLDEAECEFLLKRIISRYVEEILGGFKIETFLFANKFLTYFFNRLFSSYFAGSILNFRGKRRLLQQKLQLAGYVEETRELFKKGTIVLLPTHQSNLDSVLIGYYMQLMVGLPAFSYGAGLNLYNVEILGYYMNRLGAYKVDRRKRNAIYHETLFTFLKLSVQGGVNNLFFPAGGRVRDGKIEQNLKMGLLSALIQAQKATCIHGVGHKVFVVPVVMNYHFVLEARALIDEYLSKRGREKFSRKKKPTSSSYRAVLPYIFGLVSGKSEAVLSFGKPMDVMGNPVDASGQSFDKDGQPIELADYFKTDGVFKPDFQRESIYTKKLAAEIATSYVKHACVLSSQLVAFTSYQYLKQHFEKEDIFGLLAVPPAELVFDSKEFLGKLKVVQQLLIKMADEGRIFIHDDLREDTGLLLAKGIKKLGVFHLKRPLKMNSDGKIVCKDLKLLYYYANRLSDIGFEAVFAG